MKFYELTESKKPCCGGIEKVFRDYDELDGWYVIKLDGYRPRYMIDREGNVAYVGGFGNDKAILMPYIGANGSVYYFLTKKNKNGSYMTIAEPLKILLTYSALHDKENPLISDREIDQICENVKKEIIKNMKGE